MRGRRQERIEAAVDHLAAAALGGAAAFACFEGLKGRLPPPQLATLAALAGALLYLVSARLLRRVKAPTPNFDFAVFRLSDLELRDADELLLTEQAELVLTDADRLMPAPAAPAGELVLDDILAELGPDSRVVRLFDRAAMPSPAQLSARIERHLEAGAAPPPDASHALHEALNELRRSLR